MSTTVKDFGTTSSGHATELWTLKVDPLEIEVTNFGASLVALRAPNRDGQLDDIVLGFDCVVGYESNPDQYIGCTTGRVCNRIAYGAFSLGDETYRLTRNAPPHHLHGGGERSLGRVLWESRNVDDEQSPGVLFTHRSLDGEEGYPGTLEASVTYRLTPRTLTITYEATTDRSTPVNLTNHTYWNLAGAGATTILDHMLWIDAASYTPTDDLSIPTGEIASVLGSPLDFTSPIELGARIDSLVDSPTRGFDHNFVLRVSGLDEPAAILTHEASGRRLALRTTEPGLQLYSGNHLRGEVGKDGGRYHPHFGVCLETQHFPDSVNQPSFPTTILHPGDTFVSTTAFSITVGGASHTDAAE
jgi:aldose 1-epimerase